MHTTTVNLHTSGIIILKFVLLLLLHYTHFIPCVCVCVFIMRKITVLVIIIRTGPQFHFLSQIIHYTYAELQVPYMIHFALVAQPVFSRSHFTPNMCFDSTLKTEDWLLRTESLHKRMNILLLCCLCLVKMCACVCKSACVHFSIIIFNFISSFSDVRLCFVLYLCSSFLCPRVHCLLRVYLTRNKFTIISQLHLLIVWILCELASVSDSYVWPYSCLMPPKTLLQNVHTKHTNAIGDCEWIVSMHVGQYYILHTMHFVYNIVCSEK